MGDAGAGSLIMLMAALIVSGAASVTLIDAWSITTDASENKALKREADAATEVALAGDPMYVDLDDTVDGGNDDVTIYLQNIGIRELSTTAGELGIFVNGVDETNDIQSRTMIGGAADWTTNTILQVVVRSPGLTDGDDVQITVIARSETGNPRGTVSISEVIRLV